MCVCVCTHACVYRFNKVGVMMEVSWSDGCSDLAPLISFYFLVHVLGNGRWLPPDGPKILLMRSASSSWKESWRQVTSAMGSW